MMNRIHCALFVAFALTLAGCNGAPGGPPPLEGAKMGGAFTLVNQNGVKVRDTDFAGQYRLIYFGYTFCPDVCPVDVQRLMKGFAVLEKVDKAKAARIQPIFITIDPARDTPAALKQFVSAFHPRLIGLTGSAADVDRVAALYGVYFERDKPNASGAYMVNHTANAVLYGPKGQPIAIIAHDKGPEATADELARWVQ